MKWSILVLGVPSRLSSGFPQILADLCKQAEGNPVEVLALFDNKCRTVGEKRNALIDLARGEYISFVDDDDRIAPDYVASVLDALSGDPDVVAFEQEVRVNGGPPKRCLYDLKYAYQDGGVWRGKPAHTHVWRREFACRFPGQNFAEDSCWAKQMSARARTQRKIDRVLYYYDFDERTSETRERV